MHHLCSRVELERTNGNIEILCSGLDRQPAFALQAENFLNNILHNEPSRATGNDATEDLQVIEEIWRQYLTSKSQFIQEV
jgi:predicted dehydrogenase